MAKLVLLVSLLLVFSQCLKPSEVGVNDWTILSLGELLDLSFSRSKIHFYSSLNSLGYLDSQTGEVQSRSSIAESEKVIGYSNMVLTAATRYGQLVSHFITATGIDSRTSNAFNLDNRTVQWVLRMDEN